MNTFDKLTEASATSTAGITFHLGDVVTAGKSKLERTIVGISSDGNRPVARALRNDGGAVSSSMWLPVDKLRLVRPFLSTYCGNYPDADHTGCPSSVECHVASYPAAPVASSPAAPVTGSGVCPKCGRAFSPRGLPLHARKCTAAPAAPATSYSHNPQLCSSKACRVSA